MAVIAVVLGVGLALPLVPHQTGAGRARRAAAVRVAATRAMLGVHWVTEHRRRCRRPLGWFALCSIAFGGRLLRFDARVELAVQAAERDVPKTRFPPPVHH